MKSESLAIATLNIIDGRRWRLNAAVRFLAGMKIDLAVLTEMKLSSDHYTKHCFGYNVIATESDEHSGGVAIVYKKSKYWALESVQCFGPNVIRATIVYGQKAGL